MPRRILTCSILLCASALCWVWPVAVNACGVDDNIDGDVFLDPAITGRQLDAPFFFDTLHRYYGEHSTSRGTEVAGDSILAVSLQEWTLFFGARVDAAEWADLMTKATDAELDTVLRVLRGEPQVNAPGRYAKLAKMRNRASLEAAVQYVATARLVDRLANAPAKNGRWWDPPSTDELVIDPARRGSLSIQAVAALEKQLTGTGDVFLRQRYAFQIVRARFYGGERQDCIAAYESLQADLGADNSVAWRALAYVAGAHYRARRYAEANVLYARIFDAYPPLRKTAYLSFHPQEETDWRRALELAGSLRTRTVLWQMLGIAHDGPRAMAEIYELDPTSDLLPLLIVREVNRLEYEYSVYRDAVHVEGLAKASQALLTFIETAAARGGVASPEVWHIAAAHLYGIEGDKFSTAQQLEVAASFGNHSQVIRRQIRATAALALANANETMTPAVLDSLAEALNWLEAAAAGGTDVRAGALFWRIKSVLAARHLKAEDYLAAVCLVRGPSPVFTTRENVDAVIAFLDRTDKSPYERVLARLLEFSRSDLVEMKAALALNAGDIRTAAAELATVKTVQLNADPFTARINDCHDCDAADPNKWIYSKAAFVARMSALEREAAANPGRAAHCWYELGNAYYNITWYGNSRTFYEDLMRAALPGQMERAEAFYRRAYEASMDRDFKARAAFMAAKCEQNRYFIGRRNGQPDFVAGEWYRTLRSRYADTTYFAEILKECGYFRTFMSKNPLERR